jgi:hypothetical protein
MILEEIMNQIRDESNLDSDVLPADFFDLIGGISPGG